MRCLLVGGTGFIGSHLARRILADGHRVDLLVRPSSDLSRVADILPGVGLHRASLADGAALRACLATARPTHILHLAADTGSRNVSGVRQAALSAAMIGDLLSLLGAAADMAEPPRLLLRTGSIAEYGAGPVPFREAQREQPETGYAAAITACTHFACAVAPTLPFPILTARLTLVYGRGQAADFLVPSLIESCLSGRPMRLRNPLDRRDPIHVHDAADILYRLSGLAEPRGGIVNVGSGRDVGVRELAGLIAELTGASPALFDGSEQQREPPLVHRLAADRMRALLGDVSPIPLVDGLRLLIADVRAAGARRAA